MRFKYQEFLFTFKSSFYHIFLSRYIAYGIIIYYIKPILNFHLCSTYVLVCKMLVSLDSMKLARHCGVIIRGIMPHTDEIVLSEVKYYGIITALTT